MPVSRFDCPPPGRAEQITTRIAYLILGVGVSSWAALVPYAKTRLGLDEAVLGMLLPVSYTHLTLPTICSV